MVRVLAMLKTRHAPFEHQRLKRARALRWDLSIPERWHADRHPQSMCMCIKRIKLSSLNSLINLNVIKYASIPHPDAAATGRCHCRHCRHCQYHLAMRCRHIHRRCSARPARHALASQCRTLWPSAHIVPGIITRPTAVQQSQPHIQSTIHFRKIFLRIFDFILKEPEVAVLFVPFIRLFIFCFFSSLVFCLCIRKTPDDSATDDVTERYDQTPFIAVTWDLKMDIFMCLFVSSCLCIITVSPAPELLWQRHQKQPANDSSE